MKPRGEGEQVRYAVTASPLGLLLVAETTTGLCAVALADTEDALLTELRGRYPAATHTPAPASLAGGTERVLCLMQGGGKTADLPWDLCCTPFQLAAWRAMQQIPWGQTLTYSDLARQLGTPQGQVAVGQACARNPLALVIPCHRVLAHGNRPHHWRWGVHRKVQLLAMEQGETLTSERLHPPLQAELF